MSALDKPSDTIAASAGVVGSAYDHAPENWTTHGIAATLLSTLKYLDEREWVIVNHQLAAAQVHIESLAGRLHVSEAMREQYERFWQAERKKNEQLQSENERLKRLSNG